MTLTDTPGRAFDEVSLDVVGPLPTTADGYTYSQTMQELLTKYSIAAALKSVSAFINHLICRFGAHVTSAAFPTFVSRHGLE